jgi:hypothetical protein
LRRDERKDISWYWRWSGGGKPFEVAFDLNVKNKWDWVMVLMEMSLFIRLTGLLRLERERESKRCWGFGGLIWLAEHSSQNSPNALLAFNSSFKKII